MVIQNGEAVRSCLVRGCERAAERSERAAIEGGAGPGRGVSCTRCSKLTLTRARRRARFCTPGFLGVAGFVVTLLEKNPTPHA